jgi:predicted nucleic acid-binding protein
VSLALFVDSGFWFALQVRDDRWHVAATRALQTVVRRGLQLVTSSLVVGETYTLLRVRAGREPAVRFLDTSLADHVEDVAVGVLEPRDLHP